MSLALVAAPVLLDTSTEAAQLYVQWARLYHYGHQIMPALAIGTLLLYAYACTQQRVAKRPWVLFALAGATTISIVPFTWIVMVPTNNELFRREAVGKADPRVLDLSAAKELVVKWTWLHAVRSLLPLVGAVLGTLGIL